MEQQKDIVFISCGQYSSAEKELGKQVVELVRKLTSFEPYFAENQSTFEGFTQNILGALNRSVGLIAIMHHRGSVSTPSGTRTRASVWVEQELAIAAFLQQVLGREMNVRLYIQRGIAREGMRDQLLLNPIEFDSGTEVLDDLAAHLPTWKAKRSGVWLKPLVNFKERNITQERHDYELIVWLRNDGRQVAREWKVDIVFPRPFMDSGNLLMEQAGSKTHRRFRITNANRPDPIFPGDEIKPLMRIPYFVDHGLYHDKGELFQETVEVIVWAEGQAEEIIQKPIAELQNF